MLLGVTQEQHPDRCRLFAQWKGFDWPILHDPINLLEAAAVPIVVAIDEQGVVRSVRPKPETLEQDFLDREFHTGGAAPVPARPPLPIRSRSPARPERRTQHLPGAAWGMPWCSGEAPTG